MSHIDPFLNARNFLIENRTDYDKAYSEFKWPKYDNFNWALDYFDHIAVDNKKPALWVVDEGGEEIKLSFAEMSQRSNQVANYLRDQGVNRGDRILMMLNNVVPLWETMLAAIKLGAVLIPATTLLAKDDIIDRLERGQVRHIIASSDNTDGFEGLAEGCSRICIDGAPAGWNDFQQAYECSTQFEADGETKASDTLLLYFTSGTTSKPKLVEHTHQSYPIGHLSTMYWLGLKQGDIHLNISSPGWAKHAWSNFFAPWNAQATVFIYNYSRFDAPKMLNTIGRCGVTSLCAPPTVWRMFIQQDLAAFKTSLRELIGAGEPLNPEVIEQVENAWNITIRDGFGQTETTAQIGNSPGQVLKPGSMGRPLPGYTVALLDPTNSPAQEGEVSLTLGDQRPLGLMAGYFGDNERTAEAMEAGYYHTGDVASIDDNGYITYVGRADDVFKASDYRISPFELESVLIEHDAVAEAAVVPSPDPVRLAVPKAFVILAPGSQPSAEVAKQIFAYTRDNLAPYKRIRRIEFTDLPKTVSGKIRRVELRKSEETREMEQRAENEFWEEDFPELKS